LLHKTDEANESKVQGKEGENDKRVVIDEQKFLVPKRNTAEVVKESRKEPALPQEGFVKAPVGQKLGEGQKLEEGQKLDEGQKLEEGQKLGEGQKLEEGQKLAEGQKPDKEEKLVGVEKLVEEHKLEEGPKLAEGQKKSLRRSPESLKPRGKDLQREERENRALNDEVRIAGERRILTNSEDERDDNVKPRSNATVTRDVQENIIIQNIVRNKTIGNMPAIQSNTKASSETIKDEKTNNSKPASVKSLQNIQPSKAPDRTDNSEARNDGINSLLKIQPSLLGKLLEQSRMKRIRRDHQKKSSHGREI
jgi:hypothetical protein